jgi:hypothetical protein
MNVWCVQALLKVMLERTGAANGATSIGGFADSAIANNPVFKQLQLQSAMAKQDALARGGAGSAPPQGNAAVEAVVAGLLGGGGSPGVANPAVLAELLAAAGMRNGAAAAGAAATAVPQAHVSCPSFGVSFGLFTGRIGLGRCRHYASCFNQLRTRPQMLR